MRGVSSPLKLVPSFVLFWFSQFNNTRRSLVGLDLRLGRADATAHRASSDAVVRRDARFRHSAAAGAPGTSCADLGRGGCEAPTTSRDFFTLSRAEPATQNLRPRPWFSRSPTASRYLVPPPDGRMRVQASRYGQGGHEDLVPARSRLRRRRIRARALGNRARGVQGWVRLVQLAHHEDP